MLYLNVMLVTAFVILVSVAVGEVLDAHRALRAQGMGQRR